MSPRDDDRLVYSSAQGRVCPACGRSESRCRCRGRGARARIQAREEASAARASDGIVRVGRSTKGRRGKIVSTVTGVPLEEDALESLAGELKRRCGTGGSVKDGVIEIQGEHRDTLVEELEQRGFKVKRAG
ncbi:MAG: stress response translation initiation inhibitor YciH [Deltaproteobacteria bacterium]|jgi:translation initiation factor 1|nr:stress response translation initiation inhibitor YciH [Deltaproteobacteria bacterium]MBW2499259.1 stress response translation initiation inhibitor YciH [Deltaproteobacteria bacterium]